MKKLNIPILIVLFMCIVVTLNAGVAGSQTETISLSSLDIYRIEQGWGQGTSNRSVMGQPLTIAGKIFEQGIGTHANSTIPLLLGGKAVELSGLAGLDDESRQRGSVVFKIEADGKEIWNSGLMRFGDEARPFALDVKNVKSLMLLVLDGGDGADWDHADWVDLKITMIDHAKPKLDIPPVEDARSRAAHQWHEGVWCSPRLSVFLQDCCNGQPSHDVFGRGSS